MHNLEISDEFSTNCKKEVNTQSGVDSCILISDQKEERRRGKEIERKRKKGSDLKERKNGEQENSQEEKEEKRFNKTDTSSTFDQKWRPPFRRRL